MFLKYLNINKLLFLIAVSTIFISCNVSTSSNGTKTYENNFEVTVVDGYIKDAIVKDSNGKIAKQIDSEKGLYVFEFSSDEKAEPRYPIYSSGGTIAIVDLKYNVDMEAYTGNVISPISTILKNDAVLEKSLTDALNISNEELKSDYIKNNNKSVAKLSQLFYAVLQDDDIVDIVRNDMRDNPVDSLDILFDNTFDNVANSSKKTEIQALLIKAKDFDGDNVIEIDTHMDEIKKAIIDNVYNSDDNNTGDDMDDNNTVVSDDDNSTVVVDDDNGTTTTDDNITNNPDNNEYLSITSPITGEIWLDRNLGATQVCTSYDDTACYGWYFQYGRLRDGHQKEDSLANEIQATSYTNAGDEHIYRVDGWLEDGIDDSFTLREAQWIKSDGTGICPIGFRVPTRDELAAETISYVGGDNTTTGAIQVVDSNSAFENFLKIPSAGLRSFSSTSEKYGQAYYVRYWTSGRTRVTSTKVVDNDNSSYAYGIRCIKD